MTLNIIEGSINCLLLTLPNGEEHLTSDIRGLNGINDYVTICTSKTTRVKGDSMLEQMKSDMVVDNTPYEKVVEIEVEDIQTFEHNAHLISYLDCTHPIFKELGKHSFSQNIVEWVNS